VGAEADKLKRGVVRLAVDQDEVASDMAVAAVSPLAGERVVAESIGQGLVGRQRDDSRTKGPSGNSRIWGVMGFHRCGGEHIAEA